MKLNYGSALQFHILGSMGYLDVHYVIEVANLLTKYG